MAAAKVKTLAEQKRDLIARGDLYRQAMVGDFQRLERSLSWVPRTVSLGRTAWPLLLMASPLVAWVLTGKKKKKLPQGMAKEEKAGKLARLWSFIRIAQQVVPFVHAFLRAWPAAGNSDPTRKPQPAHSYRTRE